MSSSQGAWSTVPGKAPPSSILQAAAKAPPSAPAPNRVTSQGASSESTSSNINNKRHNSKDQKRNINNSSSSNNNNNSNTHGNSKHGNSNNRADRNNNNNIITGTNISNNTPHKSHKSSNRTPQSRSPSGGRAKPSVTFQQQQQQQHSPPSATRLADVELWTSNNHVGTADQASVQRIPSATFMACRMQYLKEPGAAAWTPHPQCQWISQDRAETIQQQMSVLWHFEPLQVNEETRFKARALQEDVAIDVTSVEEQLRQATGILNKLSWTTLDRLTNAFIQSLQRMDNATLPPELVLAAMKLIVQKAMLEPHFAELYANFANKLAMIHKVFKKTILSICRDEFDATSVEFVAPPELEPAEAAALMVLEKKKTIGLMQFIGELYKLTLIKGVIMIGCLQRLLQQDDEEKLECFCKLMTTIGFRLHEMVDEPEVKDMWRDVSNMAGRSKGGVQAPSVRIKFLLQDLLELRDSGWIQRREEDKAKTLKQIHQDVAAEEAQSSMSNLLRSNSTGGARRMSRSQSSGVMMSKASPPTAPNVDGFLVAKPKRSSIRRVQSDVSPGLSSLQKAVAGIKTSPHNSPAAPTPPPAQANSSPTKAFSALTVELLEPKDCGEKAKNILKEYFVGGDIADAILSIEELVAVGKEGHLERGAAVIEGAIFLVLEMKEADVRKMLTVLTGCLEQSKVEAASIPLGIRDPLEFLRDIEIDAPLAASLLAIILAAWMDKGFMSLEALLKAPDEFLQNGRPADFAVLVLGQRTGGLKDEDVETVGELMAHDECQGVVSVREWIEKKKQG